MPKNENKSSTQFGSFADLAGVKANEVEKPKPLPTGFYSALISGPYKEHKAKSGNFAMRFPVKLVEALEDNAKEAIASDPLLQKAFQKDYHIDFWMSPDARYRFTEFGIAMGLDENLDLLSMGEALAGLGEPFLVQGTHGENQRDPEMPFFQLDNPAPLSEYQPA